MSLALVGALVLVGCTSNPVQPVPEQSSDASAAPETPPSATPAPEPTRERTGIPVGIPCDSLITADEIYEFNPNFGVDPGYAAAPGSAAETILSLQGVACGWLNQTSGDTIEVAVAHLEPQDVEQQKNATVADSNMVPTYKDVDEGYFTNDGSTGRADVFVGDFWIVLTAPSSVFFEPGDAERIVSYVAAAVR